MGTEKLNMSSWAWQHIISNPVWMGAGIGLWMKTERCCISLYLLRILIARNTYCNVATQGGADSSGDQINIIWGESPIRGSVPPSSDQEWGESEMCTRGLLEEVRGLRMRIALCHIPSLRFSYHDKDSFLELGDWRYAEFWREDIYESNKIFHFS